jgi:hypothetical protein
VTRAEEFEQLRALLFAIAYRILGSVSEAEDALQETWLRYEASPTPHVDQGLPLGRGDPDLDRRAAFGPLAALQQPLREVGALTKLRDRQLDRAGAGVELPGRATRSEGGRR